MADTLSRLSLTEEDFTHEAFAYTKADLADFPVTYPLSYKLIAHEQQRKKALQKLLKDKPDTYKKEVYKHTDKSYDLIERDGKIALPPPLQLKGTEWYHMYLRHPGETRLELTMGQHFHWTGMRKTIRQVCRSCNTCKRSKKRQIKYGEVPPKSAEEIPWHTLCIDLIGPYSFGCKKQKTFTQLR